MLYDDDDNDNDDNDDNYIQVNSSSLLKNNYIRNIITIQIQTIGR